MLITLRAQRVNISINNVFRMYERSTFFRRNLTTVGEKFREMFTIFVTSDVTCVTLSSPVLLDAYLHISYFQKQNGEREKGRKQEMKEV